LSAVYHVCSFNSVAQRVSCTCVRAGAASRITCLSQAPHRMGRAEQRFHAVVSELVIQQREVALPSRGRSIGWRRLETTYWKPRPAVISGYLSLPEGKDGANPRPWKSETMLVGVPGALTTNHSGSLADSVAVAAEWLLPAASYTEAFVMIRCAQLGRIDGLQNDRPPYPEECSIKTKEQSRGGHMPRLSKPRVKNERQTGLLSKGFGRESHLRQDLGKYSRSEGQRRRVITFSPDIQTGPCTNVSAVTWVHYLSRYKASGRKIIESS
jgi:hypothetical protein